MVQEKEKTASAPTTEVPTTPLEKNSEHLDDSIPLKEKADRDNGEKTRVIEPIALERYIEHFIDYINEKKLQTNIVAEPVDQTQPAEHNLAEHNLDEFDTDVINKDEIPLEEQQKRANYSGEFINPADSVGEVIVDKILTSLEQEVRVEKDPLRKKDLQKKVLIFQNIVRDARGFSLFLYSTPQSAPLTLLQEAAQVGDVRNHTIRYVFNLLSGDYGGTSNVWYGWDLKMDRPVAIKSLRYPYAFNKDFTKYSQDEAKALGKYENKRVVGIYDAIYHLERSNPYLIMEYLNSNQWEPLTKVIDRLIDQGETFRKDQFLQIVKEVFEIFTWFKEKGIVHRDWKTDNLFIAEDSIQKEGYAYLFPQYHIKVGDFGVSNAINYDPSKSILGTASYNPPDIMANHVLDKKPEDDLFSIAVMFLRMLGGERYYKDFNEEEIRKEAKDLLDKPYHILNEERFPRFHAWAKEHIPDSGKRKLFLNIFVIALWPQGELRYRSHRLFFDGLLKALS